MKRLSKQQWPVKTDTALWRESIATERLHEGRRNMAAQREM